MARMKFPGTNKGPSLPEKEKKLNMFGRRRKEQFPEKRKGSVIRPAFISLRRYREIFGDSDEEVEVFQCRAHFSVLFMRPFQLFGRSLVSFLRFYPCLL